MSILHPNREKRPADQQDVVLQCVMPKRVGDTVRAYAQANSITVSKALLKFIDAGLVSLSNAGKLPTTDAANAALTTAVSLQTQLEAIGKEVKALAAISRPLQMKANRHPEDTALARAAEASRRAWEEALHRQRALQKQLWEK